jgi:hypothetical protein
MKELPDGEIAVVTEELTPLTFVKSAVRGR